METDVETVPTEETVKLYRVLAWKKKDNSEIKIGTNMEQNEVPLELVESFYKKGEVFSLLAESEEEEGMGEALHFLCDDYDTLLNFILGMRYGLELSGRYGA